MITSARYFTEDKTIVECLDNFGNPFSIKMNDPDHDDHRKLLESEGISIEDYVVPEEKIPESVEKKLERLTGISMKELRKALRGTV